MAKWLLDPGHGGVDPGATYKGIRECDNVLKLDREIKDEVRARIFKNMLLNIE